MQCIHPAPSCPCSVSRAVPILPGPEFNTAEKRSFSVPFPLERHRTASVFGPCCPADNRDGTVRRPVSSFDHLFAVFDYAPMRSLRLAVIPQRRSMGEHLLVGAHVPQPDAALDARGDRSQPIQGHCRGFVEHRSRDGKNSF